MVCLVGGFGVPPGDVVSLLPLSLEDDGFLVPVVNGRGYCVHGHDVAHQRRWNSCREVSDQDVGVGDVGKGDMVFECKGVLHKRGRV